MARGRQMAELVRWILQNSEEQSQIACPLKIMRFLIFQCPRIKYPKKNCIFRATHSLVLMPGKRFLSCGVFVVQKLPLSDCIKAVRTGLYCSISCCLAEVSSDSFDLDVQYWGAVSSTWVMNVALSSLSPGPGLWNCARVWPIKPCAELVTGSDQHIIKTFLWWGRNWVKLNYIPVGWKAFGNVISLWSFLALRYGLKTSFIKSFWKFTFWKIPSSCLKGLCSKRMSLTWLKVTFVLRKFGWNIWMKIRMCHRHHLEFCVTSLSEDGVKTSISVV